MPNSENRSRSGSARPENFPRRRRSRRKGLFSALIYFVSVIVVSALLACVGWVAANDMLALSKGDISAVVSVSNSDTIGEIANNLEDNGIIEYPLLFRLYARFSGARDKITMGSYSLNTRMDYRAIVAAMSASSSNRMTVQVTIPEGYTVQQILQLMADSNVNTLEALEDFAANYNYAFSFLQDIPLGNVNRLEGYLFPDTYEFYLGENPKYAINKLLVQFDAKVTDAMREQAVQAGYSLHEIITAASMIEKETTGEDQATISSVIFNRLKSPNFSCLQIDATVQYALPERKENLSYEDLKIDSPYNTYLYPGLPAGPICNPGLAAIKAALNPSSTGYYYYCLGNDGVHHFFKTSSAFDDFKASLS